MQGSFATDHNIRMDPVPLYQPSLANSAYQLRFSWTAWPSRGTFPAELRGCIGAARPLWEEDGMRVLEQRCTGTMLQILFSVLPSVSPQLLAMRAKGRLDHAVRKADAGVEFSRKLAVSSVGDNTRRDLEMYVAGQVQKEAFANSRFEESVRQLTIENEKVDLSAPAESSSGRYWYNLHLVLVVSERERITDLSALARVRDATQRIADKKGHSLSRVAILPDHLHLTLRPLISESANDVAFAYQNNLAHELGRKKVWQDSFYAGTFGEYTMQAVRKHAE